LGSSCRGVRPLRRDVVPFRRDAIAVTSYDRSIDV